MSQKIGAAVEGLRPCKRYIATHDSTGKSVYTESPEQVYNVVPRGGLARSFSVASVPANLTAGADIKAYRAEDGPTSYQGREIVPTQPGANLLVIDLEPGAVSAMHRTVSIDFSVCVIGEIDHELDGGEKVRLYPGVSIDAVLSFVVKLIAVGSHHPKRYQSPLVQSVENTAREIRSNDDTVHSVRYCWRTAQGGPHPK